MKRARTGHQVTFQYRVPALQTAVPLSVPVLTCEKFRQPSRNCAPEDSEGRGHIIKTPWKCLPLRSIPSNKVLDGPVPEVLAPLAAPVVVPPSPSPRRHGSEDVKEAGQRRHQAGRQAGTTAGTSLAWPAQHGLPRASCRRGDGGVPGAGHGGQRASRRPASARAGDRGWVRAGWPG